MTDLLTFPKRLKIISKSSSLVTGFSLQMNKTFSGGAISASGRSPTISKMVACAQASLLLSRSSISAAGSPRVSSRSSSGAIRPF